MSTLLQRAIPIFPLLPCFIFLIVLITWHTIIFTCLLSSTSTPLEYSFLWAEILACFAHIPFPAPEEWHSNCSKYLYNIQRSILKEISMNLSSSLCPQILCPVILQSSDNGTKIYPFVLSQNSGAILESPLFCASFSPHSAWSQACLKPGPISQMQNLQTTISFSPKTVKKWNAK